MGHFEHGFSVYTQNPNRDKFFGCECEKSANPKEKIVQKNIEKFKIKRSTLMSYSQKRVISLCMTRHFLKDLIKSLLKLILKKEKSV